MMKLLFPLHFQHRMMERGIDADHVKSAIKNPDSTEVTFQGRIRARKKIDAKRVIEVIYYKQGFIGVRNIVVITAYYQPNE